MLPGRSTCDVLEGPIEWLVKAGLAHRVPISRTARTPLGAMLHPDPSVIHQYELGQFKGYLAETFALMEMVRHQEAPLYTWRGNTKAKSMKVFREKYQPERIGANQSDNGLPHAPIYRAGMLSP